MSTTVRRSASARGGLGARAGARVGRVAGIVGGPSAGAVDAVTGAEGAASSSFVDRAVRRASGVSTHEHAGHECDGAAGPATIGSESEQWP